MEGRPRRQPKGEKEHGRGRDGQGQDASVRRRRAHREAFPERRTEDELSESVEGSPGHRGGRQKTRRVELTDSTAGHERNQSRGQQRLKHARKGHRPSPQPHPSESDGMVPPAAQAKRRPRRRDSSEPRAVADLRGRRSPSWKVQDSGSPGDRLSGQRDHADPRKVTSRKHSRATTPPRSRSRSGNGQRLVLRPRSVTPPLRGRASSRSQNRNGHHSPASETGKLPIELETMPTEVAAKGTKPSKPAGPLGYGASKKVGDKGGKAVGFGYGASKTITCQDGSETSSEYTSGDDSSDDGKSSSDSEEKKTSVAVPNAGPAVATSLASKANKNPQSADALPVSAAASQASGSQSEESSEESSAQSGDGVPPEQAASNAAGGEDSTHPSQETGVQSWLANADGDRLRARSKAAPKAGSDSGQLEKGQGSAMSRSVTAGGQPSPGLHPATDPYDDAFVAIADPYATDDPYLLDAATMGVSSSAADADPSAAALEGANDHIVRTTTAAKSVARRPVTGASSGTAGKKMKKWRRRVSWAPPQLLELPESEDALTVDFKLSMNSAESQARRATRNEHRDTRRSQAPAATQSRDSMPPDYTKKCTALMTDLEEAKPIHATVLTFWEKLTDAERKRFSSEFPEFMRYTT